jgi:small conductance mechanosensitive channel
MEKYFEKILDLLVQYAPKLAGALLVLVVGLYLIRVFTRIITRIMEKRNTDASLRSFIRSLFNMLLKVLLVISVMGMIGIEMTSFIAILGAAGLAVGMALSGTLQNFAGGVMILLFKPYKAGDYIEAQGFAGTVSEIQIFNTILLTVDNKTIIIPNSKISNDSMINYSTQENRRVDWVFGIGYGDSVENARKIIDDFLTNDERVLKDPAHQIVLSELGDSSVNITVRAWVKAADYWDLKFEMNEKVYNKFNEVGLNIPFPQMDVHLHQA